MSPRGPALSRRAPRRLAALLFLSLLGGGLAAPAGAQDAPADAPGPAQEAPTRFDAADGPEAMRYRHLWIAYGALWLLAFGLVWRTWRRQEAVGKEIEALRARIAELEGGNG